jgi:hypothetical protein
VPPSLFFFSLMNLSAAGPSHLQNDIPHSRPGFGLTQVGRTFSFCLPRDFLSRGATVPGSPTTEGMGREKRRRGIKEVRLIFQGRPVLFLFALNGRLPVFLAPLG